jgi:hypothetical protein
MVDGPLELVLNVVGDLVCGLIEAFGDFIFSGGYRSRRDQDSGDDPHTS